MSTTSRTVYTNTDLYTSTALDSKFAQHVRDLLVEAETDEGVEPLALILEGYRIEWVGLSTRKVTATYTVIA